MGHLNKDLLALRCVVEEALEVARLTGVGVQVSHPGRVEIADTLGAAYLADSVSVLERRVLCKGHVAFFADLGILPSPVSSGISVGLAPGAGFNAGKQGGEIPQGLPSSSEDALVKGVYVLVEAWMANVEAADPLVRLEEA